MAALVAPGAPVSVLLEYGLAEAMVDVLLRSGVGTIEKLGGMTPEQLEEIQGIGPEMVGPIQESVNAYYNQFEDPGQEVSEDPLANTEPNTEPNTEMAAEPNAQALPAGADASPEEGVDATGTSAGFSEIEPDSADGNLEVASSGDTGGGAETAAVEGMLYDPEGEETAEQFGTIEVAGSPHKKSESAGPESTPEDGSAH
jgi:N utilization substance protein A